MILSLGVGRSEEKEAQRNWAGSGREERTDTRKRTWAMEEVQRRTWEPREEEKG